jgi:peroxiredoxin
MKNIAFLFLFISSLAQAQIDTFHLKSKFEKDRLPDVGFSSLRDSTWVRLRDLDTSKPLVLVYFSTDCPSCLKLTQDLVTCIDSFPNIQIVMVSGHERKYLREYVAANKLDKVPILVLRDEKNVMHDFFDFAGTPTIRLYGRNRKLFWAQDGRMTARRIKRFIRQYGR